MRRWVGRWIAAVGVIHCLVGLMIFSGPLTEIVTSGLWNSVDGHKGRPLAFWFEFAGLLTIVFGLAIDSIEIVNWTTSRLNGTASPWRSPTRLKRRSSCRSCPASEACGAT